MCDVCERENWDNSKQPDIVGGQFGVTFYDLPYETESGVMDPNPQFMVLSEDDGIWHATTLRASVVWLPDLIITLRRAQQARKPYYGAFKEPKDRI